LLKLGEISLSSIELSALLEAALSKNACLRFQVRGFSMSPFIKDNDTVTISPIINSQIGFGKIAAFRHPLNKRLVIHRVVGRSNGLYFIKGDRIFRPDGMIPKENILGLVSKIERNNKSVWIGMGFERVIIAFLSRIRVLNAVFYIWRSFIMPIRRFLK